MAARPFFTASLASLFVALVLGLVAPWIAGTTFAAQDVAQAHLVLAVFGALLPGLTGLHLYGLGTLHGRHAPPKKAKIAALVWTVNSVLLAISLAFVQGVARRPLLALASFGLLGAAGMTTGLLLKTLPRRKQSVVDIVKDPLTKGDDASFTQARFAQFFLAPAVAMSVLSGPWWQWSGAWASQTWLAGIHLTLAGYALVSTYSITHLWIPRFAKVPAIAAGAIKGELHSSLLGLVFLTAGFGFAVRGLIIAGGAFLFFGCFTWMGVLGANIMRNKSKTQRVTPEFTYVPWVFTGVFWLVCGVLLGEFLNAVPAVYVDRFAALRFTHAHAVMLGGFVQIVLGLGMRMWPMARGVAPLPFQDGKWGFYSLNLGLVLLIAGSFGEGLDGRMASWGGALAFLGVAVAFMSLARHPRRSRN